MSRDTSSTGLFNSLFGFIGELLFKFLLIGACIGGAIAGILYFMFS